MIMDKVKGWTSTSIPRTEINFDIDEISNHIKYCMSFKGHIFIT